MCLTHCSKLLVELQDVNEHTLTAVHNTVTSAFQSGLSSHRGIQSVWQKMTSSPVMTLIVVNACCVSKFCLWCVCVCIRV